MSLPANDRLYKHLPAIYRIRDQVEGKPLEALLSVIAQETDLLEQDISNLYDNWFVETCDEWVVPYIGDLLDVRELYAESAQTYGQQERRAYVANTLAYRRRKGTAPILEQLARDITGWRALVVEFFERLATTQNLDRIRPASRFVSIRSEAVLPQMLGTPFENQTAYTPDIRPASRGKKRYRAGALGLFLWRLDSYPLERVVPNQVAGLTETITGHCYTFSPLGYRQSRRYDQIPLFNKPQTETDITQFAKPEHLPIELPGQQSFPGYSGSDPVLKIFINGQSSPLPPAAVMIARLSKDENNEGRSDQNAADWDGPEPCDSSQAAEGKKVLTFDAALSNWVPKVRSPQHTVAVDPTNGRLAFLDRQPPQQVEVSYAYGFSGDIGGGPYHRQDQLPRQPVEPTVLSPLFWPVPPATVQDPNPLCTVGNHWNETVAAWQALRQGEAVPLKITLDTLEATSGETSQIESDEEHPDALMVRYDRIRRAQTSSNEPPIRREFNPGIINQGLAVSCIAPSTLAIEVGRAVDEQGRIIELASNLVTHLDTQKENLTQNALLLLSYLPAKTEPNWQLHLVPVSEVVDYPSGLYIQLVYLIIDPDGTLADLVIEPKDERAQFNQLNLRPAFRPGVVTGLDVDIAADSLVVRVTPGKAIDRLGRSIDLPVPTQQDFSDRQYQDTYQQLAISHRTDSALANWQLTVVPQPENTAESQQSTDTPTCNDSTFLPLERLFIPPITISDHTEEQTLALQALGIDDTAPSGQSKQPSSTAMTYQPGIIEGLEVCGQAGDCSISVRPGRAVDEQGRPIELSQVIGISDFNAYQNQSVIVAIYHPGDSRCGDHRAILFPAADAEHYPETRYLRLANLSIDTLGQLAQAPDTKIRTFFQPGIAKGLSVLIANKDRAEVIVQAGTAVNRQGIPLVLEQSCTLSLGASPGRLQQLFISPQPGQGWSSLGVVDHGEGPGWQLLGMVPQTPPTSQDGIILLQDNRTYPGDISLQVPEERRLRVLAASGYRPHLQGGVTVQGSVVASAKSAVDETDPGQVLLEGLLIEGQVTVKPGNLGQLSLLHSTVVPESETNSIEVESVSPSESTPEPAEDSESILMALVMYLLQMIRKLIVVVFGDNQLTPRQVIKQLLAIAKQEAERGIRWWRKTLLPALQNSSAGKSSRQSSELRSPYLSSAWFPPQAPDDQTNRRLKVDIEHSICGALRLPIATPGLKVSDSMIDATELSHVAIAAPGSQAQIERTTVLGLTQARSLNASDSLFAGQVQITQQQTGCARFCYVPQGSRSPRRYRCQPDLAISEAINRLPEPITALVSEQTASGPKLLAGSLGHGLFKYEESLPASPAEWQPFWENDQYSDFHITLLGLEPRLNNNRLWLGTLDAQLLVIDTTTGEVIKLLQPESLPEDLQNIVFNTRITSFVRHTDNKHIFIGTAGNGLLSFNIEAENQITPALSLANKSVTALAASLDGNLFAGTSEGVFRSVDAGKTWQAVNRDLTNLAVSAIALHSQPGTGTLQSNKLQVTGQQTQFEQELRIGDTLNAAGQTRRIATILSDQQLILETPFEPALTEPVEFVITSRTDLFVATAGGGVFRSTDKGNCWTAINQGLANLNVTTLVIDPAVRSPQEGNLSSENSDSQGSSATAEAEVDCLPTCLDTQDYAQLIECPPTEMPYTIRQLFCGTAGSGLFNFSPTTGHWQALANEMSTQKITALSLHTEPSSAEQSSERSSEHLSTLLAGTNIGTIWRSQDEGTNWTLFSSGLPDVDQVLPLLARLQPVFSARQYGHPNYGQLAVNCPAELQTGAEDGSEMGAFSYLKQPQREANLRASLKEYLRFGLDADIFYMT